ncbi:hypothetical protein CCMA1212_003238 [Trichoderma ghanense]|uniref:Uncharacterized protein n=1 Tax=Trichoderma ghanense TaxID=65468 RepID=A0ABY2HDJ0_9HYPO
MHEAMLPACPPARPPACLLACWAVSPLDLSVWPSKANSLNGSHLTRKLLPSVASSSTQHERGRLLLCADQWLQAAMSTRQQSLASKKLDQHLFSVCHLQPKQVASRSEQVSECVSACSKAAWAVDASGDGRCDVTGSKWLDVMRPKSTPWHGTTAPVASTWTWTWTRWDWNDEPSRDEPTCSADRPHTGAGLKRRLASARGIVSNLKRTREQRSHAEPGSVRLFSGTRCGCIAICLMLHP